MARPKTFSQEEVLRLAGHSFTAGGYEGTSVDDLVQALNLHRGSLYKAFGSKRGLFLAVLEQYVTSALPNAIRAAVDGSGDSIEILVTGTDLDLLLVAGVERGRSDTQVATLVRQALRQLEDLPAPGQRPEAASDESRAAAIVGTRIYRRLLHTPSANAHTTQEGRISDGSDPS